LVDHQKFLNSLELGSSGFIMKPMPADLGYHSPKPRYAGQRPMAHRYTSFSINKETGKFIPPVYGDPVVCKYLPGDAVCYYDGSSLNARRIYGVLIAEGEEAVWQELEDYYKQTFEEDE
jgi:hypothetical protein